ncbi:hypothetical protein ACTMU2_13525 [Cupriavidus basilensis]
MDVFMSLPSSLCLLGNDFVGFGAERLDDPVAQQHLAELPRGGQRELWNDLIAAPAT